jgi:hypothetical protein
MEKQGRSAILKILHGVIFSSMALPLGVFQKN